tara:strand:+ start:69 stop:338 length:270 start_codon:yes stop_codon:yes gene_type:complete
MTNIIVPRRRDEWFDNDGNFTRQAFRFFEELTDLTNSTNNQVESPPVSGTFSTQTQFLQQQIDGLPEFTIDTTGFTVDTTIITTDKVIA